MEWHCFGYILIVAQLIIIIVQYIEIGKLQDELDELTDEKYGSDEMWYE